MSQPRFSIVLPTRQRHQTLGSAIRSVLFQPFEDFELVVADNASTEETWQVVRQFPSDRIRYERAPRVLPMNENWEMGLRRCRGEYIFFLGDDDALMPDGLILAARILALAPVEVLSWRKFTYWWDNAISEPHRGRLFVHFGHEFQQIDGHAMLKSYYDWQTGFGALPGIYSSFVRRDLIDRIRARSGGTYFAAGSPDVYSGVANAYFASSIGYLHRGLSLCGNSASSTGCSHFFRSKGAERREAYYADEGKTVGQLLHPSLVPTVNLEMNLADAQIRAKEILFPDDGRYQFNVHGTLAAMAAAVNRDPASYDDTVRDIHALATRFGVDASRIQIPGRAPAASGEVSRGLLNEPGSAPTLAIDGTAAGVRDAADAARLAFAVLPGLQIQ